MKKALLYGFLFFFIGTNAQPPDKFYVVYGGAGDDVGYDIKQSKDGNYVLTGSSSSAGNGQTDLYLMKINKAGHKLWERYIGGAGSEVGRSLLLMEDSGYVVTGYTSSYGNGGYDLYLIRTDKSGNLIWQRTIGGNDWDFGFASVFTSNTEIMVTGYSYANGNQDLLLAKIDTAGTVLWEKRIGGAQEEAGYGLYTPDGTTFFITGVTKSMGDPDGDVYLVKCDTQGDTLFTRAYGSNAADQGNALVTDAAGNILLACAVTQTNGNQDATLIKTTASGQVIWQKSYGLTPENKEMFDILNSASPVVGEQVAIFSANETPSYNKDTKVIYINSGGDYFGGWFSGSFGFPQDDELFAISACSDKGYISCGYTRSYSQSASNKDIFIVKRDSVLNYGVSIVGINEFFESPVEQIRVYPNPCKGTAQSLRISLNGNQREELMAKLYDTKAQEIPLIWDKDEQRLLLPELSPGIYHIVLKTNTVMYSGRLIVTD